jgi:hypothetical protein
LFPLFCSSVLSWLLLVITLVTFNKFPVGASGPLLFPKKNEYRSIHSSIACIRCRCTQRNSWGRGTLPVPGPGCFGSIQSTPSPSCSQHPPMFSIPNFSFPNQSCIKDANHNAVVQKLECMHGFALFTSRLDFYLSTIRHCIHII